MSASPAIPEPPRPPVPPRPPRSGSNLIAIIVLVLALIVVVAIGAVWLGIRFIGHEVHVTEREGSEGKRFSIQTPVGSLEMRKQAEASPAALGLPIYPGAREIKDDESAAINLNFLGGHRLRILVAKFRTSDPVADVQRFYLNQLTKEVGNFARKDHLDVDVHAAHWDDEEGNFIGTDRQGKTVLEIKRRDDTRIVALQDEAGGTRIDLVRLSRTGNVVN